MEPMGIPSRCSVEFAKLLIIVNFGHPHASMREKLRLAKTLLMHNELHR